MLDEADKMLGVGFAPQIDRVKTLLGLDNRDVANDTKSKSKKKERVAVQVGLFTATMPRAMHALTAGWLNNPKKIALKSASSGASAGRAVSSTVVQVVQVCAEHKKPAKLMKHLEGIKAAAATASTRHAPKILIFFNRIKTVRFIFKLVAKAGFRTAQLHGERSQEEREEAIKDFKSGKAQVLVASDVAARGLDVQNLPYVVNYDFPGNLETYIHRVGRTGRLAADGHAFSFLTREMAPLAGSLLSLLREHDQSVDPNLVKLAQAYEVAAKRLGLPVNGTSKKSTGGNAGDGGGSDDDEDNEGDDDDELLDNSLDPKLKANRPAPEDVLRELDMKSKAQKKKDKSIEAKKEQKKKKKEQAAAAAGQVSEEEESSSDEEEEESFTSDDSDNEDEDEDEGGNVTKNKGRKKTSSSAGADRPEFLPFKKFSGARPGYVFKKGGMGVGYYVDYPPHKVLKDLARARKQIAAKYASKPVGGAAAAKAGVTSKSAAKAVPLLPGKLKTLKRQQQEYPSSDEEEEYFDEDEGSLGSEEGEEGKEEKIGHDSERDGEGRGKSTSKGAPKKKAEKGKSLYLPTVVSAQKKRGALPGRLRKKLAKDRLKKAAAAAAAAGK